MSVSEKKPINRQFERVSAEDVRRAAEYQAAILADVAGRRGTLHGRIIDGAVRDADSLSKGHYPVFSAGLNPCGPTKLISGRVNHPISVAGATVQAGDLVVADIDGVVVIPRDEVQQVIALAKEKLEMETRRLAAIREGDLRPHWLDDALRKAGMLADGETL